MVIKLMSYLTNTVMVLYCLCSLTPHADATIEFAELDSQIEVNEGDSVQFKLLLTTPGSGQLKIAIYATLTLVDGDKASM